MKAQTYLTDYERLRREAGDGAWGKRILAEISFLSELSRIHDGKWDIQIGDGVRFLSERLEEEGAITKRSVLDTEALLQPLSSEAKQYTVICAAHAHIDMNWMWGYAETAALTIDTFRTMLQLMREYPEFHFSQSQASVYHIVEEYAPELLPEIKKRVHEGRWEVTASSWVENDKNMPNGESMSRHLLYSKQYLSQLLEIPIDSLQLDFEPDTFGHNANLPEILQNGGVKYYYHCRGFVGESIYRWRAPSGAEVLVYREPAWYNENIDELSFSILPEFCGRYGVHEMLKIYGVGDHGGGPTRRDIERLLDMKTWPLFPTIQFGSIHHFFQRLEAHIEQFPVIDHELNYVFTGCYTSQSRIKQANRLGENRLYDAEVLQALVKISESQAPGYTELEPAWRRLLFNQFHDILPGSGTIETREFALGEFQRLMASVVTSSSASMNSLCASMDTSAYAGVEKNGDMAMGAGAGFGANPSACFRFTTAEVGSGAERLYTAFNTTQYPRDNEAVEFILWDWQDDPEQLKVKDSTGRILPHQVLERGVFYWGHHFLRVAVWLNIPPIGYVTCHVSALPPAHAEVRQCHEPRCDKITDGNLVLENQQIKAVFRRQDMLLLSLYYKAEKTELIDPRRPAALFQLLTEDPGNAMTAWRVGTIMAEKRLNEDGPVFLKECSLTGRRKWITYEIPFLHSRLTVTIVLDENSSLLHFSIQVDWQEAGNPQEGVPQLRFSVPCGYSTTTYRYDIPFGSLDRDALPQDVPANSFACAVPVQGNVGLALLSDCKYGYRGDSKTLSVNLIRGSYDPDPYPEIGIHTINLGIWAGSCSASNLIEQSERFQHPVSICANSVHPGSLPVVHSFIQVDGVKISAIKRSENGKGLIFRLYNPSSEASSLHIHMAVPPKEAYAVDFLERYLSAEIILRGDTLLGKLEAFKILNIFLRF